MAMQRPIPMQKIECRKFCAQHGWRVVLEKAEKGVSGSKVSATKRDAIQELKAEAEKGNIDILLVFLFDRLGRIESETPYLNPIGTCGNVAQAGAVLAVAIKATSAKTKQIAYPSCLSALLGITEPAVFGVNLRFVKPFVMSMIGGGVGGFLASFFGLRATGMSITGIPGTLLYLNEQLPLYILVNVVALHLYFPVSSGVCPLCYLRIWRGEEWEGGGKGHHVQDGPWRNGPVYGGA